MKHEQLFQAVGNLLDRWEMMSNDVKSYVREQEPEFAAAVEKIETIMEDR